MSRHLLALDSAYTFRIMTERGAFTLITSRDLGGYFSKVWTCHPIASLLVDEDSAERVGAPVSHEISPAHTFIEGKVGRFRFLRKLSLLNFAIAQALLIIRLVRLVLREKIQIVRAENPQYLGVMALIVARLTRRPLVVGVWGNPSSIRAFTGKPISPRLFSTIAAEEKVERFVLRRADRVLVQNEDNREFVISMGVSRDKTRIFRLGNSLHPAHFTDPGARTGGREELAAVGVDAVPTLLVVSRLQALKRVDDVIKMVGVLKSRGRDVRALFVGDGPHRDAMASLADELGVSDRILFLGNRDQEWLAKVVPVVTIVISPLTGMALGEVALGAAPVAAYDIDWHSELIVTGETGELVPYLDVDALASAVERLLQDPDRARAMGQALRSRALAMLDPEINNEQQRNAYDELISTR